MEPAAPDQKLWLIIGTVGVVLVGLGLIWGSWPAVPGMLAFARPSPTFTATSTKTPAATPTRTATPSQTPTATWTSSATVTPTQSATASPTASPSATPRPTSTWTATPVVVVEVTTPPASTVSAAGEALTVPTETPTAAGPPTVTLTPTPTPTPVPRTVRADSLPDYSQTEDHFWFTRPFTAAHLTWGSAYYPFGTNAQGQYLWHHGIDIQNPLQTPIQAVADGLVVHAGPDLDRVLGPYPDFFGQAVLIRHDRRLNDEPVYTLYGHVSQVLVTEGEHVSAGQIIARVGQEGIALGPHLHLEVRLGQATYWDTRNPDLWIRPDPAFGVIAGRVIDADGYFVPQQLVTLHRAEEPDRFWRQSWTYPDNEFKFDPVWGETYTFSDVPVGPYVVKTHFDGRLYSQPITVTNQSTTFVHIEGLAPPPSLSPEATVEVPGSATPEASPTASE